MYPGTLFRGMIRLGTEFRGTKKPYHVPEQSTGILTDLIMPRNRVLGYKRALSCPGTEFRGTNGSYHAPEQSSGVQKSPSEEASEGR